MLQSEPLKRFKNIVRRIPVLVNTHYGPLDREDANQECIMELATGMPAAETEQPKLFEAGFPEYDNDQPTVPEE